MSVPSKIEKPTSAADPTSAPVLAKALEEMKAEPLLPVEKKLVGWSIGLGIVLLVVLMWVSQTFFRGP